MASVTTDEGILHVFDIRSRLRSSAVLYDVKKAVSGIFVIRGLPIVWATLTQYPPASVRTLVHQPAHRCARFRRRNPAVA